MNTQDYLKLAIEGEDMVCEFECNNPEDFIRMMVELTNNTDEVMQFVVNTVTEQDSELNTQLHKALNKVCVRPSQYGQ